MKKLLCATDHSKAAQKAEAERVAAQKAKQEELAVEKAAQNLPRQLCAQQRVAALEQCFHQFRYRVTVLRLHRDADPTGRAPRPFCRPSRTGQ